MGPAQWPRAQLVVPGHRGSRRCEPQTQRGTSICQSWNSQFCEIYGLIRDLSCIGHPRGRCKEAGCTDRDLLWSLHACSESILATQD